MEYSFKKTALTLLTLLTLIFVAIWGVTPAYAATLIVTNLNDSGAGSLRAAITSAGPGDTITFAAGLAGGTIHLASTLYIDQDVTIDGNPLNPKITISGDSDNNGSNDVRLFYIYSGITVTLNKLVLTKGYLGNGGAIYNDSGTLTITNSIFSGNDASGSGGAIDNYNGMLIVTNTMFSGNTANGNGGAIYNDLGTMTLTDSTLSGNSAHYGGGVLSRSGTLTVINSVFSGNSAIHYGGGIANNSSAVTVINSTFSGNSARDGGGISTTGNTLTLTNSTIAGNSAEDLGGGIYNSSGLLTVTNSTISGNSTDSGGGIFNHATLILTNSTLSGNSSAIQGGGITNYGTLHYANTIIANSSGFDCRNISSGMVGTNANNLVEDGSCSAALSGDPKLGPLANNGGSTQTLALLTGSPVIDAGDDAVCAAAPVNNLDQRGVMRPAGAHCDIGAYEGQVSTTTLALESVGAQDGWVLESSENGNTGDTINAATTLILGDNATKKQYRSILSFNSGASLPDNAIITAATLKLKKNAVVGGGDPVAVFQGFMIDIKNGFFGTTAALQPADFQAAASGMYGPSSPTPVSNVYSISLTSGKTHINKMAANNGLTQIRLRFKLDDDNNAAGNYLSLFSGDAALAADRPQLVIAYYIP